MNSPGEVSDVVVLPHVAATVAGAEGGGGDGGGAGAGAVSPPGIELRWGVADGAERYEVSCAPYGIAHGAAAAAGMLVAELLPRGSKQRRQLGGDGTLATKPAWQPSCTYSFDELVSLRTNSFQRQRPTPLLTLAEPTAASSSSSLSAAAAAAAPAAVSAAPGATAAVPRTGEQEEAGGNLNLVSGRRVGSRRSSSRGNHHGDHSDCNDDSSTTNSVAYDLVFRVRGVSTRTGVKLAGPWSAWTTGAVWGRVAEGAVQFDDDDHDDHDNRDNDNINDGGGSGSGSGGGGGGGCDHNHHHCGLPGGGGGGGYGSAVRVLPAGLDEFSVRFRQMVGIPGAMVPWGCDVLRCPNDIVGIFESSVPTEDTTRCVCACLFLIHPPNSYRSPYWQVLGNGD